MNKNGNYPENVIPIDFKTGKVAGSGCDRPLNHPFVMFVDDFCYDIDEFNKSLLSSKTIRSGGPSPDRGNEGSRDFCRLE